MSEERRELDTLDSLDEKEDEREEKEYEGEVVSETIPNVIANLVKKGIEWCAENPFKTAVLGFGVYKSGKAVAGKIKADKEAKKLNSDTTTKDSYLKAFAEGRLKLLSIEPKDVEKVGSKENVVIATVEDTEPKTEETTVDTEKKEG